MDRSVVVVQVVFVPAQDLVLPQALITLSQSALVERVAAQPEVQRQLKDQTLYSAPLPQLAAVLVVAPQPTPEVEALVVLAVAEATEPGQVARWFPLQMAAQVTRLALHRHKVMAAEQGAKPRNGPVAEAVALARQAEIVRQAALAEVEALELHRLYPVVA